MSTETNTERVALEFNASVNGKEMFAYYAAGCCGARTFYGLNGKNGMPSTKPTPEEVVTGIINSGISGNIMMMTDAYSEGVDAKAFKKFVESNDLGSVTISKGSANPYTGRKIVGLIFEYNVSKLQKWLNEKLAAEGKGTWVRPKGWCSNTDATHMDSVFYQYGGRPKLKSLYKMYGSTEPAKIEEAPQTKAAS